MPKAQSRTIDLVCGMNITGLERSVKLTRGGVSFQFCGEYCRNRFKKDPKRFMGTPLLELVDVYKTFVTGPVETKVLRGLSLRIWEGDFVVIIGASGSGKSTALNMIGLLDQPTSGKILLRGQDILKLNDDERALLRSNTFGFVFQQYNLIPWLTAYENVTAPSIFARRTILNEKLLKDFEEIGLAHRIDHHPVELSGGEKQRVALLRALVNEPPILIGDEPTGNLDSTTGEKILDILLRLYAVKQKTLIIVTHDAGFAERASQILAIKDGVLIQNHKEHAAQYVT